MIKAMLTIAVFGLFAHSNEGLAQQKISPQAGPLYVTSVTDRWDSGDLQGIKVTLSAAPYRSYEPDDLIVFFYKRKPLSSVIKAEVKNVYDYWVNVRSELGEVYVTSPYLENFRAILISSMSRGSSIVLDQTISQNCEGHGKVASISGHTFIFDEVNSYAPCN